MLNEEFGVVRNFLAKKKAIEATKYSAASALVTTLFNLTLLKPLMFALPFFFRQNYHIL